jgi:hypothetical protein
LSGFFIDDDGDDGDVVVVVVVIVDGVVVDGVVDNEFVCEDVDLSISSSFSSSTINSHH